MVVRSDDDLRPRASKRGGSAIKPPVLPDRRGGSRQFPADVFVGEAHKIASRLAHPNIVLGARTRAPDAEGRPVRWSGVLRRQGPSTCAAEKPAGRCPPGGARELPRDRGAAPGWGLCPPIVPLARENTLRRTLRWAASPAPGPPAPAQVLVPSSPRIISPQKFSCRTRGRGPISDFRGLGPRVRGVASASRPLPCRGRQAEPHGRPKPSAAKSRRGRTDLHPAGVLPWEMLTPAPLFTGTPLPRDHRAAAGPDNRAPSPLPRPVCPRPC